MHTIVLSILQNIKLLLYSKKALQFEPQAYPKEVETIQIERGEGRIYEPIPKIVWMYWENRELPDYIKGMLAHNKRNNPSYEFRMLHRDTYMDYLPDLVFKANMPIANKTDVIRLALLYRYGGIWMDATIVLQDSLDWIHDVRTANQQEFIGYYSDNGMSDNNYPVVETYFMAAPKGSLFIKHWFDAFKGIAEIGSAAFYAKLLCRPDFNDIRQKILNPSYLLVYLAGQLAYREYPNYHIYIKRAEDSALFLQECYKDNYLMNYALCRMPNPMEHLRIIKLCSGDRMFISFYRKMGMIRKDSLIGHFIQEGRKS